MELIGVEPTNKSKSIALKSKGKSVKTFQVVVSEEETLEGDSEDSYNVEVMAFFTKRLQYLNKKKKMLHGRSSGVSGSSYKENKDEQNTCFNCMILGQIVDDCPDL